MARVVKVIEDYLNGLKTKGKPVLVAEVFFYFLYKYRLKIDRDIIIKRCKEKGIELF